MVRSEHLPGEARAWPAERQWDEVMAVDLKGTWLCSRAAAAAMRRDGGGVIVNLSVGRAAGPARAGELAGWRGVGGWWGVSMKEATGPHGRVTIGGARNPQEAHDG